LKKKFQGWLKVRVGFNAALEDRKEDLECEPGMGQHLETVEYLFQPVASTSPALKQSLDIDNITMHAKPREEEKESQHSCWTAQHSCWTAINPG
jgi:hypothetical protein